MSFQSQKSNFSTQALIVTAIFIILFSGLYYSTFKVLVRWWHQDDYSYCWLIPLIVFYLLWEKKNLFSSIPVKPTCVGFIPFISGIFLFWLGELGGEFYAMYISSWLILVGWIILLFGIEKVKTIVFPLFFTLTIFPLPEFFNNRVTLVLKLISSKIGVAMMQIYGMSAYREGNIIDLGFTKLQVVDACSGLRYLYPMIVLSILIAYYYRTKLWKRMIIVLSSVPLTILSNSLRIALTGILSMRFGSAVVEGFFHDFEGLLIFLFTLVVLLLEIWILKWVFPDKKEAIDKVEEKTKIGLENNDQDDVEDEVESTADTAAYYKPKLFFKTPHFIVPIVLLLICIGISQGVEFREFQPMKESFKKFPMQIGNWQGRSHVMDQKFIDALNFTDYIMADYVDDTGKSINFYVAYYASQRKGESIHSPASCLRGGGWQFKKSGTSNVELKNGTIFSVQRAIIEKEPYEQVSYYWFPARDRILTNAYQMKIFNFWDALTRQRTDGSLVRVIAQVYPDETVADAEQRLQAFIGDIYPVLDQYLPK